jgi:alginate O-acetyltransferase complex protein AlgI
MFTKLHPMFSMPLAIHCLISRRNEPQIRPKNPRMLFSSFPFLVFLPVALAALALARHQSQSALFLTMIAVSLVFYGWFRVEYTLILIGSAFGNYVLARALEQYPDKRIFAVGVILNVSLLIVFKHLDFVVENTNAVLGERFPLPHIVLPLALSFITFEQISFLSDVRTKRVQRSDFLKYLAFVTFFPKLIAGPIIRYRELLPQLSDIRPLEPERVLTGLCLFCFGLFKKTVLADNLALIVDPAVAQLSSRPLLQRDAVATLLAYSLQIFFDFSAYSEMALGIAWMLGIQLPVNFYSPYKAASIIEFWRRWHITLSAFLRDYVYIPLGGSRGGQPNTSINLFIVMLVGGVWHGAAWTFVVWGALHGVALICNHLWRQNAWQKEISPQAGRIGGWTLTSIIVLLGWILFRSPDFAVAATWFESIARHHAGMARMVSPRQLWLIGGLCLWVIVMPNVSTIFRIEADRDHVDWTKPAGLPPAPLWIAVTAASALAISVIFIARGEHNAFIYFQF